MKRLSTILCGLAILAAQQASASGCKFERHLDQTLELAGSDSLSVQAAAGELNIKGVKGTHAARIRGTICASRQEWADQSHVATQDGRQAEINVVLPEVDWGMSFTGERYVYLDLELEVPADLPLSVKDSSGDMDISGVGPLDVKDSSGDMEIENVGGAVSIRDSSGDIEVVDVTGDLTIEADSSGDITGRDIKGSVRVVKDSSGDMSFRDVDRDVIVERDSSGSIAADHVGGDFRVLRDSSGSIKANKVAGKVQLPDRG